MLETTSLTPGLGKRRMWTSRGCPASSLVKMVSPRFYEKFCLQNVAREWTKKDTWHYSWVSTHEHTGVHMHISSIHLKNRKCT